MDFYYHDTDSGVLVLTADGGLNAQTAEQFVNELERVIVGGVHRLIVDCSKLEYVSSYGVAVLIRLHKHLDSETLHLPELRPLIGKTVEIIVQEEPEPPADPYAALFDLAGKGAVDPEAYKALREASRL